MLKIALIKNKKVNGRKPKVLTITKDNNSLYIIYPYKQNGIWMFDDKERDIKGEAFVAGADTVLDKLCKGRVDCTIVFSHIKFPSAKLTAKYISGDITSGTDYYCPEVEQNLWLCPTLGAYYNYSPEIIYFDFN